MQLPDSSVNQDERWHRLLVFEDSLITPTHHFAHRGEIIDPGDALDLEFAIFGVAHRSVFPDHHGGHGLSTLYVRDVEAFNAFGQVRKHKNILEDRFQHVGARLHHSEPLIVRLLGIVADQIHQRAFITALRDDDVNAVATFFRQQRLECLPVLEVYRYVDLSRDVLLVQVQLRKEGREELSHVEYAFKL